MKIKKQIQVGTREEEYKELVPQFIDDRGNVVEEHEETKVKTVPVYEFRQVEVPDEEESRAIKIQILKDKLSATDYKAIKYAEGLISESDYAPIKEERQSFREEINRLESGNEN